MKTERNDITPDWVDARGNINEPLFCEQFAKEFSLIFTNGIFYNLRGELKQSSVEFGIYTSISGYITSNVAKKVKALAEALKIHCCTSLVRTDTEHIHVNNGWVAIDGEPGTPPTFSEEIVHCRNRLNIDYNPELWDGDYYPTEFLKFLYELLEPEDVLTLQEYLGYCMLPVTKGQAMMSIIGSGGEGKSRIGVVLEEIFRQNMITGNYQKIETDKFFRYNLINKLLILDEDMQMKALSSTGYIKTLITSEIPVDVEAKYLQSCQEYLYSRILTFGNGSPKALYDHSDGFSRRLLILSAKPKPENRVDDPFIADRFIAEKDRIFCWMLDGLRRLAANDFRFTRSEKAKANVSEVMRDSCNIIDFFEDREFIAFDKHGSVTSRNLYRNYSEWCEKNGLEALKRNTFIKWVSDNQAKFGIRYEYNVPDGAGRVRGFSGIRSNTCKMCNYTV